MYLAVVQLEMPCGTRTPRACLESATVRTRVSRNVTQLHKKNFANEKRILHDRDPLGEEVATKGFSERQSSKSSRPDWEHR
jgi:hypothetical protein